VCSHAKLNKYQTLIRSYLYEKNGSDLFCQIRRGAQTWGPQNWHHPPQQQSQLQMQQQSPIDHHGEIKKILQTLTAYELVNIMYKHDEEKKELTVEDIEFLLLRIQLFYERLYKYWHANYKFYKCEEIIFLANVFERFDQLYSHEGMNVEKQEWYEKFKKMFNVLVGFLASLWMNDKYQKMIIDASISKKKPYKYKFTIMMLGWEELIEGFSIFNDLVQKHPAPS
jgi:hypothetical protein